MTAVIGLDLSITATGIATPDGSTTTLKLAAHLGDSRLKNITDYIAGIDNSTPAGIRLAVLEDIPTHAKGAGITGMVHGAVRLELIRRAIPYALISPATLKAFATGKGNADKSALVMAAYKRAGREFDRNDDNQCDAWWLRIAGLDWLNEPAFPLPEAQRVRLAKGKWPTTVIDILGLKS